MVQLAYPRFLRTPITPETVANAVLHAVRQRSRQVFAPKRWAPLSLMRGIVSLLADRALDANVRLHALLRELESETSQSATERK